MGIEEQMRGLTDETGDKAGEGADARQDEAEERAREMNDDLQRAAEERREDRGRR
ncbi:hypothetical protein [Streptomyces sp. Y1]|uniref:CsbD family protein n=1 Tax=Streptomyces sp. Y1 TaxID=3238634 RepID=A0AB39TUI1_9ACTN